MIINNEMYIHVIENYRALWSSLELRPIKLHMLQAFPRADYTLPARLRRLCESMQAETGPEFSFFLVNKLSWNRGGIKAWPCRPIGGDIDLSDLSKRQILAGDYFDTRTALCCLKTDVYGTWRLKIIRRFDQDCPQPPKVEKSRENVNTDWSELLCPCHVWASWQKILPISGITLYHGALITLIIKYY